MAEASRDAAVRFHEEALPPYDASHGTPNRMVRRVLEFELPQGRAEWEQTDYGHPGRFNDWEPRHIDTRLQPKTKALRATAEALSELVGEGA